MLPVILMYYNFHLLRGLHDHSRKLSIYSITCKKLLKKIITEGHSAELEWIGILANDFR